MTSHGSDTLSALTGSDPAAQLRGLVRYVTSEVESSAAAVFSVTDGVRHSVVASIGYRESVVDYLSNEFVKRDPAMKLVFANPRRVLTWADVPAYRTSYSAAEVLTPAGFHEGTSVSLTDRNGTTTAVLHVSIAEPAFPLWLKELVSTSLDFTAAAVTSLAMRSRSNLSARELEVLEYLVSGLTNVEIANTLYLSRSTVNTHVEHILQKIGAKNRLTAAVNATRWGLLDRDNVNP